MCDKEVLKRKNEQIAELRSKLLETRRILNDRVEAARSEVRRLNRELAFSQRGMRVLDADAIAHNRRTSMDQYFNGQIDPEPYVRFGAALRQAVRRHDIRFDGKSVVDVGMGPGIALNELLRGSHPTTIAGFDFSARAIEVARAAMPEGEFSTRDIFSDPPADQFDVVICTEVLEHLQDPGSALRTIAGLAMPGGTLVLTVPDGRLDFSEKHINFWSPEGWRLFIGRTIPEAAAEFSIFVPHPGTPHRTNLAVVTMPS